MRGCACCCPSEEAGARVLVMFAVDFNITHDECKARGYDDERYDDEPERVALGGRKSSLFGYGMTCAAISASPPTQNELIHDCIR